MYLLPPSYKPGGLCSEVGDLPRSPSSEGPRRAIQGSGFVYRGGRPDKAEREGGRKGRQGAVGTMESCGSKGQQQAGHTGRGGGSRRREAAVEGAASPRPPDPTHPSSPRPQEGFTHHRLLRAGSCWLQEREKAGQLGTGWWGRLWGGCCQLGLQSRGTGSPLRPGREAGGEGVGHPLRLRPNRA